MWAIDVGHGQLDWKLRNDPRVVVREGVNARYLAAEEIPGEVRPGGVRCQLHLGHAADSRDRAAADANMVEMMILVKPQFEVGKGEVGKGGIVRDPALHRAACDRVQACVEALGFRASIIESPIRGAEGNREFLLYAQRNS